MLVIKGLSIYDENLTWSDPIPFGMTVDHIKIASMTLNGTIYTNLQSYLTAVAMLVGSN